MTVYEIAITTAVGGLAGVVTWCALRMAGQRDRIDAQRKEIKVLRGFIDADQEARYAALESSALAHHLDFAAVCLSAVVDKTEDIGTRRAAKVYLEAVCAGKAWAMREQGGRSVEDPPATVPTSDRPE